MTEIQTRRTRAQAIVNYYQELYETEGDELVTSIGDLIGDLQHLCDEYGIEWTAVEERGSWHHDQEVLEAIEEGIHPRWTLVCRMWGP